MLPVGREAAYFELPTPTLSYTFYIYMCIYIYTKVYGKNLQEGR